MYNRIQSWLQDSDKVHDEDESMITLVPVRESKRKINPARRRKQFSYSSTPSDTASEMTSSEYFDNTSIIPLKRPKKIRMVSDGVTPDETKKRSNPKKARIGRTFWDDAEDKILKEGLRTYGPATKNRWAKIKLKFFSELDFHVLLKFNNVSLRQLS